MHTRLFDTQQCLEPVFKYTVDKPQEPLNTQRKLEALYSLGWKWQGVVYQSSPRQHFACRCTAITRPFLCLPILFVFSALHAKRRYIAFGAFAHACRAEITAFRVLGLCYCSTISRKTIKLVGVMRRYSLPMRKLKWKEFNQLITWSPSKKRRR